MGSGNLRSLSPWKPFLSLAILNCKAAVRLIKKELVIPTRPLAKIANCSLGDKFCCSNVAVEDRSAEVIGCVAISNPSDRRLDTQRLRLYVVLFPHYPGARNLLERACGQG